MRKITTETTICKKYQARCNSCHYAIYTWDWKRGCKITGKFKGNKLVKLTLEENMKNEPKMNWRINKVRIAVERALAKGE